MSLDLSFNSPIVLIEGLNGAGKTSLIEALHYLCYLRSFRTSIPQELVQFGKDNFFIKAELQDTQSDFYQVQVGFSEKKRLVKVNNKVIGSYKELLDYYRIITITEDDLSLIKEGPEFRRTFIDQCVAFFEPELIPLFKKCRHIVMHRNALLKRGSTADTYQVWTEQLWKVTADITQYRTQAVALLGRQVQELIVHYFSDQFSINLTYLSKVTLTDSLSQFQTQYPTLYRDEQRFGRSLFGAHLDDIAIIFKDKSSRNFASRGQQKLIVLLLKVAHIKSLLGTKGAVILLLDDFMTDLDTSRANILLKILADLDIQLLFTVPSPDSFLQKSLLKLGAQHLLLTS